MDLTTLAGAVAASLHALGYLLYVRGALRRRIEPNPTSWLMWAYGTTLVVLLETDQGIHPMLRLLPVVCAACCILIAGLCWRGEKLGWPTDAGDRAALGIDLAITAVYLGVSLAAAFGGLAGPVEGSTKGVLLLSSGLSAIVSFVPILRSTRRDPGSEDWRPWAMWTLAYGTLLVGTVSEHGTALPALQFWNYPAVCMVLCGLVGWYAVEWRGAPTRPPGERVSAARSPASEGAGQGHPPRHRRPPSPQFGVYEYDAILEELAQHGFEVISEARARPSDPPG